MGVVKLDCECVELFKRAVMIGLRPRATQASLDRLTVALGEMIEDVACFVLHAALDGHVVAEHLPDRFAQRLRSVNDEQHSVLDIEATVDEIGQQRGGDGRVLAGPVP